MRFIVAATAVAITFAQALAGTARCRRGHRQETVQLQGRIVGRHQGPDQGRHDGRLRRAAPAAGQTLTVKLQKSNGTELFQTLMPPARFDEQRHVRRRQRRELLRHAADRRRLRSACPTLMRPAARRGAKQQLHASRSASRASRSCAITASKDALIPGTSYHASTNDQVVPGRSKPAARVAMRSWFVVASTGPRRSTFRQCGETQQSVRQGQTVASNARPWTPLTFERKGDVNDRKVGHKRALRDPRRAGHGR